MTTNKKTGLHLEFLKIRIIRILSFIHLEFTSLQLPEKKSLKHILLNQSKNVQKFTCICI